MCTLASPACGKRIAQIVLAENPILDELSVEYVPQIGFLTTLQGELSDRAPPDFEFAFSHVRIVEIEVAPADWSSGFSVVFSEVLPVASLDRSCIATENGAKTLIPNANDLCDCDGCTDFALCTPL